MEIRRSPCVHAVLPDREIVKDRDRPMKPRSMKPNEIATRIGRSWRLHVSSGKLSIKSLISSFCARVLMDDRVNSGPRDRRFLLGFDACDAATSPATERFRGNIVPHEIKRREW